LCLIVASAGCGKKAAPADGEGKPSTPELDALATQVEQLVVARDVAGLEAIWLTPSDLTGCEVKKKKADEAAVGKFTEGKLAEFKAAAGEDLVEAHDGKVLKTIRWTREKASYMDGKLEGESCKAQSFGRINVIVKPTSGSPQVVEHRFNLQLVEGGWKPYRYFPNKPDCSTEAGKKHNGCKYLARSE
jgi:hypothetical protein